MLHRHRLIVTVVAAFSCIVRADVLFVDAGNCPGPGDGSELDPYCSINTAILNAVDTDEILVAPGTYFENVILHGKAITLRSSDGPIVTTIVALFPFSVVHCVNGEGPDTVIEGFTITGGAATLGGGMINDGSSPTVINCRFTGNTATFGAGMHNRFGANPTVIGCEFTDNQASGSGGGMYNTVSSPTVTNCTFERNTADSGTGGGMSGGLDLTISDCTFTENTAATGGGVHLAASGYQVIITDCSFIRNTASNIGGGMLCSMNPAILTNCVFTGNVAGNSGGGLGSGLGMTVSRCTFSGNIAGVSGGGWYKNTPALSETIVSTCSFENNQAPSGDEKLRRQPHDNRLRLSRQRCVHRRRGV